MLRLNSKQKFKFCVLILTMNTCSMSFKDILNKVVFYLSILVLVLLRKMALLNSKKFRLLDVTLTLLFQAFVPSICWVETLSTIVFLIKRLPYTIIDFYSPFFRHSKTYPDYIILHTFGCVLFIYLPIKGISLGHNQINVFFFV